MNPLRWKRKHQIALLGAAIVGACIGIFAGARQLEPSMPCRIYQAFRAQLRIPASSSPSPTRVPPMVSSG